MSSIPSSSSVGAPLPQDMPPDAPQDVPQDPRPGSSSPSSSSLHPMDVLSAMAKSRTVGPPGGPQWEEAHFESGLMEYHMHQGGGPPFRQQEYWRQGGLTTLPPSYPLHGNGFHPDHAPPPLFNGGPDNPDYFSSYLMGPPGMGPHSISGMSRESSRDDLASMMDGQTFEYEDCFKVDRRKLELLMHGRFDPLHETAVEFFTRIGNETCTTVIWPSRLKIGAKSKKDPHIRVGGQEDCVRRAKGRIMEYLSAKSNRVTMKMDVSYTDHSHVIGKGGNTIRRVMAETNCHIHFPDSNRTNPNEKSNQVSIAGEIEGVERARARVREQTPLVFNFELPIIPSMHNAPDNNDPYLRAIQEQYNIQVKFRQKQKNFTTMVIVRGCEWEAARVKEATLMLIEHLHNNAFAQTGGSPVGGHERTPAGETSVIMYLEISPQHHPIVLGKSNVTLKLIMQRTNTTILFPDASDPNIPSIRKGSVTVIGTIHNVYLARQQLIGTLPLVMMFDLHYDSHFDESLVAKLQEDLDVSISIKPKAKQGNKSVIIKAQERNAGSIYEARNLLLGLLDEAVKAVVPETYNIMAVSPTSGLTLPINHRTFSVSGNHSLCGSAVSSENRDFSYGNNSSWIGGAPKSPNVGMGAGHFRGPAGLPSSPFMPLLPPPLPQLNSPRAILGNMMPPTTNNNNLFPPYPPPQQQQNNVFQFPPVAASQSNKWTNPAGIPPNDPRLKQYAKLVLDHITNLEQQQMRLMSSSGNDESGGNNINNLNHRILRSNVLDQQEQLKHRMFHGESPPIPGKSPRNSSPTHEDGNLTENLSKMELNSSGSRDCGLGLSLNNSSGGNDANSSAGSVPDRRAPGCEKNGFQMGSSNQFANYEAKQLAATKAIQDKPQGEVRTPNQYWTGLGFSSSMPAAVIREKMQNDESTRGGALVPRPSAGGDDSVIQEEDEMVDSPRGGQQKHSPPPDMKQTIVRGATSYQPRPSLTSTTSSCSTSSSALSPRLPGGSGRIPSHGSNHSECNLFGQSYYDLSTSSKAASGDAVQAMAIAIRPGDDLPKVFAMKGLSKYTSLFLRHEIDLATFSTLSDQDLREIGITIFGARKKLHILANQVKQAMEQSPKGWQ